MKIQEDHRLLRGRDIRARILKNVTAAVDAESVVGRFAALFFDWSYWIKTTLHNAAPQELCCPHRYRQAAPASPLGRRFHPINTLKLWPLVLLNRILHHHRSAISQAGAALIALEVRHYEANFTNQIFSHVKTYKRIR